MSLYIFQNGTGQMSGENAAKVFSSPKNGGTTAVRFKAWQKLPAFSRQAESKVPTTLERSEKTAPSAGTLAAH